MKTFVWILGGLVIIIVLLIAGIVAGQVGGIAIRKQGADQHPLTIMISQPVVRGVPVMVHWDNAAPSMPDRLTFVWRDEQRDYPLGEAAFDEGQATLEFPCDAAETAGGLIVRGAGDGKVIDNQAVILALAGPECVQ